ncbi:MAG: DUF1697 domain-containing protein [Gemmatimonadota bacterium]|nr:DUF1697 domain-containing protein [Gemmatimonadota bacterium]MDQ6873152.1 DUF1697 domain-containing protein [Gemmatimonadota bacterium]
MSDLVFPRVAHRSLVNLTTHIALLRGINVGGHRSVGMTDLRTFLTQLGFDDVRSLLQSGNLVFGSRARTGAELERFLEAESVKHFAMEIDFFVRAPEEWKSIIRQNPFRKEAEADPGHLVVMLLKGPPRPEDVAALQAGITGPEIIRAKGRQLYAFYPNGQGRSRLTHAMIEKKLGRCTGRNWNTVMKLAVLAKSGSTKLTPISPRKRI